MDARDVRGPGGGVRRQGFADFCRALEIPFLDFGAGELDAVTKDGSHLLPGEGRAFSRRLAAALRERTGWATGD